MKIDEAATNQRAECCGQCPFARSTSKEYLDTRGDNSERFLGQSFINSVLPCHMEDAENNAVVGQGQQCAGAAKFRANLGVNWLHPSLGELPVDEVAVFTTAEELLAHHRGISLAEAEDYLKTHTLGSMAVRELEEAMMKGRFCDA